MSLRTRLAVAVGVLVAGAIAVTGGVLYAATEQEFSDEVDAFLIDRADRLGLTDFFGRDRELGRPFIANQGNRAVGAFANGRFSEDDAVAQLIAPDGSLFNLTDTVLPVAPADLELAASGGPGRLRTVDVDGIDYRVYTAAVPRIGGAVMVGRNLTEVNTALDGLARRTFVVGAIGAMLAALAAWIMASRLARPVHRLTEAAEHVAVTQDLSASIDARGTDEVGRLAASFNTMLGALKTSREQQQRLVMDASHELRTPLTSLRTNVDLLRRTTSISDDDRSEIMHDVSRELEELSTLVAELVELSTSSRRPSEALVDFDLGVIADHVAERARRRYGRTVTVTRSAPSEVRGQVSLVERAMWNLVENAVKFSPPDTPVEVAIDGSKVRVRDHGPGIPDEDRAHVFDRFYRSPVTRSAPGSGLGLSIVADIVAAHGGTTLVAEPDEGAGVIVGFDLGRA